jgi:hypothetical protein
MRLPLLALVSILAAGTTALYANSFTPYAHVGTPIISSTAITFSGATGTGITAYFYSVSAGDTDTISIFDVTSGTFLGPQDVFNNQAAITIGSTVTFTSSTLRNGDSLIFDLYNTSFSGETFSSNASTSPDGKDHAYITPFSGTVGSYGMINGTYVGMEDLPSGQSDWDYNDDSFVFTSLNSPTGLNAAVTPEPNTFALFGTGLLAAAGLLRRRFSR